MAALSDAPYVQTGVSRALDTPFKVSADGPSLVAYTVRLSATAPLSSSDFAQVDLKCDVEDTPSVIVASARVESSQWAGVGLVSVDVTQELVLMTWVPLNFQVLLASTLDGSGSAQIVNQLEVTWGTRL
jgi:hypothetical protein